MVSPMAFFLFLFILFNIPDKTHTVYKYTVSFFSTLHWRNFSATSLFFSNMVFFLFFFSMAHFFPLFLFFYLFFFLWPTFFHVFLFLIFSFFLLPIFSTFFFWSPSFSFCFFVSLGEGHVRCRLLAESRPLECWRHRVCSSVQQSSLPQGRGRPQRQSEHIFS